MPFDYQSVLDSLERAADIAWLEERDREDRDEVAAGPEDRRVEPLQIAVEESIINLPAEGE